MADKQPYYHNDIERYLQKQMSREEMHAFEKAMMDDPFLADAFEGFRESNHNISTKHLHKIEQELLGAEEKTNAVPLVKRDRNWWRIAALFIIIIGAGVITNRILNTTAPAKEIAVNKPLAPISIDTISAAQKPPPGPAILSSQDIASNKIKAGSPVLKKEAPVTVAHKKINENEISGVMAMRDEKDTSQPAASVALSSTAMAKENREARTMMMKQAAAPQVEFKGKVVDNKGQPLPLASVMIDNNHGAVADQQGNFSLKAADSVIDVSVASAGYRVVRRKLKSSNTDNKIVLNQSNEALEEVVITGKRQQGKVAGVEVKGATAAIEPEGGWQKFNQYIDSSLHSGKTAEETYTNGDVLLEFKVDEKGNPVNIKTYNPTNKELEVKAIELLKKGPKWKPNKKNAKGKVIIRF
jgi:hypothetical protein